MISINKKIYIYFEYRVRLSLIDPNEIFLMKLSEFEILHSVESYDEKTAENSRNRYDVEKRIVSKLSISITSFNGPN